MTTLEAQHEVITGLILENKKLKQERDEASSEVEKLQDALMQIKNSCVDFSDVFDVLVKIHQITVTALNSKIAK